MGYPQTPGFRAGTTTPYLFFDINMEVTTPLTVHPYIFHSQICHSKGKEELEDDHR